MTLNRLLDRLPAPTLHNKLAVLSVLLLVFLSFGPLVLPLVWLHPQFSRKTKIVLSLFVIVLSYFAAVMTMRFVSGLQDEFRQITQ